MDGLRDQSLVLTGCDGAVIRALLLHRAAPVRPRTHDGTPQSRPARTPSRPLPLLLLLLVQIVRVESVRGVWANGEVGEQVDGGALGASLRAGSALLKEQALSPHKHGMFGFFFLEI